MIDQVTVGLLISSCGTYKDMAHSTLEGLEDAIVEINADPSFPFTLEPQCFDPAGELDQYVTGVNHLIDKGAQHIFGTTTSASRKEIIPDLERTRSLLWYACPYEGYECSENVIYLGGCPNQNLLPLMHYAVKQFGSRALLVGSNYVWGWESNRIAREVIETAHGQVLKEKYYRFGDTNFEELISSIIEQQPDFVLNNLVGESSYDFLHQLSIACSLKGIKTPVLSCNFTESELPRIKGADDIRLLSSGSFFEGVNLDFVKTQRRRHGIKSFSHFYTCAYVSMFLFAEARKIVGHSNPKDIAEALYSLDIPTILGNQRVAEHNNHISLPNYIAEAKNGEFELIHSDHAVLGADPYLVENHFELCRDLSDKNTQHCSLRIVK